MTEFLPTDLTSDQLTALIEHWQLVLRAERKSPQTIKTYLDGLRRYLAFCSQHGAEPMNRTSLNRFVTHLLDAGRAAGTARTQQLAVRRFTAWMIIESHLAADPFWGVKAPKVDQPVVDPLTDDEFRALIRSCAAPSGSNENVLREPLHHHRDEAIVRLMFETGIRTGEVLALETGDLDLVNGLVHVRRGKGGIGRVVPVEPAAVGALRLYLTQREGHRLAHVRALWLGERGRGFGYDGLSRALRRRAHRAGIEGFTPTSSATPPPTAGSPTVVPNPG